MAYLWNKIAIKFVNTISTLKLRIIFFQIFPLTLGSKLTENIHVLIDDSLDITKDPMLKSVIG